MQAKATAIINLEMKPRGSIEGARTIKSVEGDQGTEREELFTISVDEAKLQEQIDCIDSR